MKAGEVLELLNISRVTLWRYLKEGKLKAKKMKNNLYDYDDNSVYELLGQSSKRPVIYGRVSTNKQKKDLVNQVKQLEDFLKERDINDYDIYFEIGSGLDFERQEFKKLLDDVINNKVSTIYITNKDRLTRLSFITIEELFKKFNTKIIVVNDIDKKEDNDKEILEELISLMHYFSTKMYSKRRRNNLLKLRKNKNLQS